MGLCCSRHASSSPRIQPCEAELTIPFRMEDPLSKEGKPDGEELKNSSDADMHAPSDAIPTELLSQKFSVIERGLDAYCENPSAVSFMQIYTCIYDLCNGREHKNAVCRAVYELYRRETQRSVQQLAASCQRLHAASPSGLQEKSAEVLLAWRHLERRFHALQASFGYLDRYFVPRACLESLSVLRQGMLEAEAVEEHAHTMWSSLARSLRDGSATLSFSCMQELAEAWGTLTHVAGMEEEAASTRASCALREHLAATFTEGLKPLGRPGTVSGTATDRVLGMQRPLVREIISFLSEQDLCDVYSVKSMQRSV